MMEVQFIGLGYIGLPTAAVIAQQGITVHGVDVNPVIVDKVNKGDTHILEKGLENIMKDIYERKLFTASLVARISDVHLIVVPTPFKGNHEPDISFVESATRSLIPLLKKGDLYIIESTSPIGTTEQMANLIFSERPELEDEIDIAYCPERVLPGNMLYELVNNDRVIGGINERSSERAIAFYSLFVKGFLHKTDSRTAEMCKLTENSSRDVQIAFANELSIICDKAGINVWELIRLANKHPRVNILQPGSGVGGHCIAVDPYFIVSDYPNESRIISTSREINNYKAFWCAEKIQNARLEFKLNYGRDPIVAIMGLAFKPNIDDLRESPAKYIAQKVMQSVKDGLLVVEPNVSEYSDFKLTAFSDAYENADIVAFLVAHKEFKSLTYRKDKVILDFCGIFNQ